MMRGKEASKYLEEDFGVIKQKAEAGDPYYQAVLGEIYFYGEQGEEDGEKAAHWAALAAQKGNPLGLYFLGFMSLHGAEIPVNASYNELFSLAFPGLQELAEEGDVRAQTVLGTLYRYGLGTDIDIGKSDLLYETAAKKGFPRAMLIKGTLFYEGQGIEKNYEKAKYWFRKLAIQGDKKARYQLANMYFNGHGVKKDVQKAMKLFRKLQTPNKVYKIMKRNDDFIIPGTLPPKYKWVIQEGGCGECCLWTILRAKGINTTQAEINNAGGAPGRGLRSNEIIIALNQYPIDYADLTRTVNTSNPDLTLKRYRSFLYDDIIPVVKKGNPVLLGVKRYPTQVQEWACDHLILIVGYNEKNNDIIYNDNDKRARVHAEHLLVLPKGGYSLLNAYNWVFAAEFNNF